MGACVYCNSIPGSIGVHLLSCGRLRLDTAATANSIPDAAASIAIGGQRKIHNMSIVKLWKVPLCDKPHGSSKERAPAHPCTKQAY